MEQDLRRKPQTTSTMAGAFGRDGEIKQFMRFTSGPNADVVKVQFNGKVVTDVLDDPNLKNIPLFAISVHGLRRKGKSFLINLLILYLKHQVQKKSGSWLKSNPKLSEVDWRKSRDSVTQGIGIWSIPYVIEVENREKICVLLMDCQGFGDSDTHNLTKDAVVALCGLEMSKIHLLNLDGDVNANDLKQLVNVITYVGADDTHTLFNLLLMVHRNWEDGDDDGYGDEYGLKPGYFEYMQGKRELNETELIISSHFKMCEEFMVPTPGGKIRTGSVYEDAYLQDLLKEDDSQQFFKYIDKLCDHLFVTLAKDKSHRTTYADFIKQVQIQGDRYGSGAKLEYFESPAELMESRRVMNVYAEMEAKEFPSYESDIKYEDCENLHDLEALINVSRDKARDHVAVRRGEITVLTSGGKKAWERVEQSCNKWFIDLKSRMFSGYKDWRRAKDNQKALEDERKRAESERVKGYDEGKATGYDEGKADAEKELKEVKVRNRVSEIGNDIADIPLIGPILALPVQVVGSLIPNKKKN